MPQVHFFTQLKLEGKRILKIWQQQSDQLTVVAVGRLPTLISWKSGPHSNS
jgi:hypothetical protein